MTIVMCLLVNEGVILGSDCRATIEENVPKPKYFDNRIKTHNFLKEFPVGIAHYGENEVQTIPISTIIADYSNKYDTNQINDYNIENLVNEFKDYLIAEHSLNIETQGNNSIFGFIIAGFSSKSLLPEAWILEYKNGSSIIQRSNPIICKGFIIPIMRLYDGYDPRVREILLKMGIPQVLVNQILNSLNVELKLKTILNSTPLLDAIDLIRYLIQMSIDFCKFSPEFSLIGGQVNLAKITKDKGFEEIE